MAQQNVITFYGGEDGEQLRERLQQIAKDQERSLSFIIREALDNYLTQLDGVKDNGKDR